MLNDSTPTTKIRASLLTTFCEPLSEKPSGKLSIHQSLTFIMQMKTIPIEIGTIYRLSVISLRVFEFLLWILLNTADSVDLRLREMINQGPTLNRFRLPVKLG